MSTIGYALLPPILKKASVKIPPFTVIAISMFVLFMLSLFMSIFYEKSFQIKLAVIKTSLFPLILVGVLNTVAFWLGILGYKYMPLWQQTLFGLLAPICTAVFAYFLLGEPLSSKLFISLLLMGSGLYIAIR